MPNAPSDQRSAAERKEQRHWRAPLRLWVTAATLTALACGDSRDADEPAGRELLLATASPDESESGIAALQQELLRAMTDPNADPTQYVTSDFNVVDLTQGLRSIGRNLDGSSTLATSYFRAIATRFPPEFASVESLELLKPRPDHVLVLVRHSAATRSVTRWWRVGDEWKATSITIRVPEQLVTQLGFSRMGGS